MNHFIKNSLFKIIFILFLSNCSFNYYKGDNIVKSTPIMIKTDNDRYNLLLKHQLIKLFQELKYLEESYTLDIAINYVSDDTLSLRGLKPMKSIKGTIEYKFINIENKKHLHSGSISQKITYGSVNSLYNKNVTETQIKERMIKSLSRRILQRIKLAINKSEN